MIIMGLYRIPEELLNENIHHVINTNGYFGAKSIPRKLIGKPINDRYPNSVYKGSHEGKGIFAKANEDPDNPHWGRRRPRAFYDMNMRRKTGDHNPVSNSDGRY